MSSATFAMIVVIIIIVTNLFLGFASARLMGHGPKSLSDVEEAIVIRFFSPKLFLLRSKRRNPEADPPARPTAESTATAPVSPRPSSPPTSPAAEPAEHTTNSPASEPAPAAADPLPSAPTVSAVRQDSPDIRRVDGKIVLPPKDDEPVPEVSPDRHLNQQLDSWREEQLETEAPCASMIYVELVDKSSSLDALVRLTDAVHSGITGQLRRDRTVLRISDGKFVWFTTDCELDDALQPLERIRQQIAATNYQYEGVAIAIRVHAAVAVAQYEDRATDLINRLKASIAFGSQQETDVIVADVGEGPELVDPVDLEVAAMTVALDA